MKRRRKIVARRSLDLHDARLFACKCFDECWVKDVRVSRCVELCATEAEVDI